jgi:hyperosmotically inducible periplasmic protein
MVDLRVAVMAAVLVFPAIGADADKDHNDAFVPGTGDESKIIKEVRHALVTLPYYGVFDDLAFRVNGGTVTLGGAVAQPVLKSNAEKAVKRVEGVDKVVNELEVLPLSPMDDQIRRTVYRAIYGDPALSDRYGFRAVPSIHIIVKNGHVTLEGVVANQMDKSLPTFGPMRFQTSSRSPIIFWSKKSKREHRFPLQALGSDTYRRAVLRRIIDHQPSVPIA